MLEVPTRAPLQINHIMRGTTGVALEWNPADSSKFAKRFLMWNHASGWVGAGIVGGLAVISSYAVI